MAWTTATMNPMPSLLPSTSDEGASTTTLALTIRPRHHQSTTARKRTRSREKGERDGEEKGRKRTGNSQDSRYAPSPLSHPLQTPQTTTMAWTTATTVMDNGNDGHHGDAVMAVGSRGKRQRRLRREIKNTGGIGCPLRV
jgi:hypothetical protein